MTCLPQRMTRSSLPVEQRTNYFTFHSSNNDLGLNGKQAKRVVRIWDEVDLRPPSTTIMVATLIEFPGGVASNSGKPLENKDVVKFLPSLININQVRGISMPVTNFCVRMSSKILDF